VIVGIAAIIFFRMPTSYIPMRIRGTCTPDHAAHGFHLEQTKKVVNKLQGC